YGHSQARRLRPAGVARPGSGRALRGRRRANRRLRALLVVLRRNRDLPRRRRHVTDGRGAGGGGARSRAPARGGCPGSTQPGGRRRAARGPPVRGAGIRHLPARGRVKATLYTDGGARGNPGPAAFAYVLEAEDGTVLAAHGEAIGEATNNVAEYRALVAGLARA